MSRVLPVLALAALAAIRVTDALAQSNPWYIPPPGAQQGIAIPGGGGSSYIAIPAAPSAAFGGAATPGLTTQSLPPQSVQIVPAQPALGAGYVTGQQPQAIVPIVPGGLAAGGYIIVPAQPGVATMPAPPQAHAPQGQTFQSPTFQPPTFQPQVFGNYPPLGGDPTVSAGNRQSAPATATAPAASAPRSAPAAAPATTYDPALAGPSTLSPLGPPAPYGPYGGYGGLGPYPGLPFW